MLKLYRGILVPHVLKRAGPIKRRLASRFLRPLLQQRLYKVLYLLLELRRQIPNHLLKSVHVSTSWCFTLCHHTATQDFITNSTNMRIGGWRKDLLARLRKSIAHGKRAGFYVAPNRIVDSYRLAEDFRSLTDTIRLKI